MKKLLPATILSFFLFSASVHAGWIFSTYSGEYRDWPVASESMAETKHKVPVFRTWPTKPYEVLGSIRHDDPYKEWRDGEISAVANEGKKKGGHAVIVRYGSESGVTALTGDKRQMSIYRAQWTALVIRFLSAEEIARNDKVRQDLLARASEGLKQASDNNPSVQFSEETGEIAFKFLLQSGVRIDSPDIEKRFIEIMRRIQPKATGELSGDWLFKASLSHSGISSSDEERFFGIAAIKHDGTNLVIVSRQGKVEFSYSGKSTGGKLEGHLGIKSFSTPAEGVMLDDKISLTFHALTGSGTAEGIVVLQRALFVEPVPVPKPTKTEKLKQNL